MENPAAGRRQGRRRGQKRPALPVQPQSPRHDGMLSSEEVVVAEVDECISSMHNAGDHAQEDTASSGPVAAAVVAEEAAAATLHAMPLGLPPELDVVLGADDVPGSPRTQASSSPSSIVTVVRHHGGFLPDAEGGGSAWSPPSSERRRSSVLRSLQHLHLHSPTVGGGVSRVSSPTVSPMFRTEGGLGQGGEEEEGGGDGTEGGDGVGGGQDLVCDFCSERDKASEFVPCKYYCVGGREGTGGS